MNPYTQIQTDVRTRLKESVILTPIAMELEELGDINSRIEAALTRKGIKPGEDNKIGLAFLVLTPKGRPSDRQVTKAQITTVRISLFCKPLLNKSAGGHQLPPLDVHFEAMKMILTWNRGTGRQPARLITWDSFENNNGEISYFADYEIPHVISLT